MSGFWSAADRLNPNAPRQGGPGCGLPHSIGRRSSRGGASAPARVLAQQPLRQRELREHNNYVRPRE